MNKIFSFIIFAIICVLFLSSCRKYSKTNEFSKRDQAPSFSIAIDEKSAGSEKKDGNKDDIEIQHVVNLNDVESLPKVKSSEEFIVETTYGSVDNLATDSIISEKFDEPEYEEKINLDEIITKLNHEQVQENEEDEDEKVVLKDGFPLGEKIIYDIKTWRMNSSRGLDKGTVTFEVDEGLFDDKMCYIFKGVAEGEGFGYKLRIASTSYVDQKTNLPLMTYHTQTGSEDRKKKLVFHDDRIEYVKLKHCKDRKKCTIKEHFVPDDDGVEKHCKKCKDKKHYTWRVRSTLKNKKPTYDLLTALYVARKLSLIIGEDDGKLRLADARDLWEMNILAKKEEVIETPLGKFDTIFLKLSTRPLNRHAIDQKSFRGLFGLKGDINIWVDKESHIPVRISGSYPIIFDVPIDIMLRSIEGSDLQVKK